MVGNGKPKLDISIGLSRKWDAREAGKEVARTAIKDLNQPPTFFLLFSTIHYKDHGGFQEFLDGVWDVLPPGTPLIGGTIASFINNYGCYTHGATALAISYPEIDLAVGIGKHTKRNPKKSGRDCALMIEEKLKNSKHRNKILIDIVSAPSIPKLPFLDRVNVIKSNFFGWIATHLVTRLCGVFGTGLGKEVDVINELTSNVSDFKIIGGSSVDSGKMLTNYQFIGDQIHTNSIVAIGCKIDLPIFLKGDIGVHQTDKTFKITGTACNEYVITKINQKPAKMQFFNLLDFPVEQFGELDHFYYKTSDYFPITFEEDSERVIGVAGIFGDSLVVSHKLSGKNVKLLSITGEEILKTLEKIIKEKNGCQLPFLLGFSSAVYLFMLGRRTFDIKDMLDKIMGEKPYLMLFPMVENICYDGKNPSIRVYSTNLLSFECK